MYKNTFFFFLAELNVVIKWQLNLKKIHWQLIQLWIIGAVETISTVKPMGLISRGLILDYSRLSQKTKLIATVCSKQTLYYHPKERGCIPNTRQLPGKVVERTCQAQRFGQEHSTQDSYKGCIYIHPR